MSFFLFLFSEIETEEIKTREKSRYLCGFEAEEIQDQSEQIKDKIIMLFAGFWSLLSVEDYLKKDLPELAMKKAKTTLTTW
jgi:hypothetical protein